MKITLVSQDAGHYNWFRSAFDLDCIDKDGRPRLADVLVVSADGPPGSRAQHVGLTWLQEFRRDSLSTAPALVYSFESRDALARAFRMLAVGRPGIAFSRLPLSFGEIESQLQSIAPLTEHELCLLVRWHCGLQSEWRRQAHDLVGCLPERTQEIEGRVKDWGQSIARFAPDQIENFRKLERAVEFGHSPRYDRTELGRLIDDLVRGLCSVPDEIDIPEAPYPRPPKGYSTIAIADDKGYEQTTIHELRSLGYAVSEAAVTLAEAKNVLTYWAPTVLLADLNFPSIEQGLELIRCAQAAGCLVIAISRAYVEPEELPDGVRDCCGGVNFQDAERIHKIIWKHAISLGIVSYE
jgi:CheY-like chemotaxis protein